LDVHQTIVKTIYDELPWNLIERSYKV